jgi:putative Ca2+/H+ antiporter (TMEM165/GDT1 family)
MDLAIVATVFPVIFIGELPDKTMFASLILATHGRPAAVWLGAAAAFLLHAVIATTVGVTLFHVLPKHAVDGVVAVLFFGGAVYAFVEGSRTRDAEVMRHATGGKFVTTAFVVIFLAEWGDLTQILTANLAAKYHNPVSVGVGAVLALWLVAALAVVGGQGLLKFVNIAVVRRITAAILVVLGIVAAGAALGV